MDPIKELQDAIDNMEREINRLTRKARRVPNAVEKLHLDSAAQVLRKKKRVLARQCFALEEAAMELA